MAEKLTFTVPLSFEAHAIAEGFRQQQTNPRKAKQVYLNTLAVYAVDFYLRCMGFETDWAASDSRNPVLVRSLDVADLRVNQVGRLECRPVLPKAEILTIPTEVWTDRIGYVAVRLNQALKQATLLGFTQTVAQVIPLTQLQSLETFLVYCSQRRRAKAVNLRNWFAGKIEAGWLTLAALLKPQPLAPAVGFRTDALSITRWQQINLGMQMTEHAIALVVTLPPEATSEIAIRVQLYPMGDRPHLPPSLKLLVMDETDQVVLDTVSREADNLIQLEFSAVLGEQFSVTVALGNTTVSQTFVI